jgi:predicted transcriptional regulator
MATLEEHIRLIGAKVARYREKELLFALNYGVGTSAPFSKRRLEQATSLANAARAFTRLSSPTPVLSDIARTLLRRSFLED